MKCIKSSLGKIRPKYPLEYLCIPEQAIFIDIETTGLYARSSNLYMIGCIFLDTNVEPSSWYSIQWFATNYEDELNILNAFIEFAKHYKYLIHFNGNQFDIPYLETKLEQHNIKFDFSSFEGIDIYKRLAPYKAFLNLPNCKQKTIEHFLHTSREDTFSGEELIDIYHDYVLNNNEQKENFLLLHNKEDLIGMLEIIAALAIPDLINLPVKVTKVQANYYKDMYGKQCPEIIMNLEFTIPLPADISCQANNCYFIASGITGKLRVPVFEEEMKYFYSNYRDYYYLPKEDIAMHKSVASFVDKEYRKQAQANNCYTRKFSSYLPQWDNIFTPFFKRDYHDKEIFFELTDEIKTQRETFNIYAHHILEMMTKRGCRLITVNERGTM